MEQLTKEMVIASLLPDIAKDSIQQLINAAKNIQITRETIQINYENLRKLYDFYKRLKERMEDENKPDKERIKARKEGYGVYLDAIDEILDAAEPIFTQLNYEIKKGELEKLAEINKKNEIMARHIEFVNEITKMIALAENNKELARIQSLVGTEKSRTTFYGDYFPIIEEVCAALLKLIDDRKGIIKTNDKLKKDYETWYAAGDMAKAAQIKEQMEFNERVIAENIQVLSEKAYKYVSEVALLDTKFVSESIKPRLHRWSWRVDDIDKLYKKRPELVSKEPNTKAINAFMKEQVEKGEMNDLDDNDFDGLTLYNKPFFVAVKSTKDAS